ncbi:VUT family protein [Paenibacillus sambharensis]|uniref:Probable queuosine precursor transporter n=1 Tax=Paenibacillus sambharensis TaxID=1803190 RepID=A0A2W1LSC2_9BACL|nr:queuosine precursor transporter [Paenibacillus sambharensis]PZD97675.1 VUT family protein [Paenibacillus sambharensis]
MFNEFWGVLFIAVNFLLFLACYRLFGRTGLFAWIGFATVLANIQVVKTVEIGGLMMTLGNTIYASIYLTTDLLNEKYGPKQARKAVWFGFFTLLASTVIMQMVLKFDPHPDDFAHEPLVAIFDLLPLIAIGSLCAYLVSQFLDVRLFNWLKRLFPSDGQLWIRTNGSTAISQLVDTLVFCTIAFAWEYEFNLWLQIFLTTYIFKFIVSVSSTPVLYIAKRLKVSDE